MPNFNVSVRLLGISGETKVAVRQEIEQKLQTLGVPRCHVVSIEPEASPLPVRQTRRAGRSSITGTLGPLLLLGAFIWAFWFYWVLVE